MESAPKSDLHLSISDHIVIDFSTLNPLAFKNLRKKQASMKYSYENKTVSRCTLVYFFFFYEDIVKTNY